MVPLLAVLSGFTISLFLAHFFVALVVERLRKQLGEESTLPGEELPAWIVGTVERFFFTLAVAAGFPGVPVAMMLWIAAKMAAYWGSPPQRIANIGALRLAALLAGVVSMSFALIGGWLVRMGWLMVG